MELLLQYGANPNVETKYIRPISLFAALHSSKCAQIVAILLRAGANPLTAKDSSNNSIYTYMQEEFEAVQDKDLKDVYKKIGRALIEYKKLALQLKYQKNIQLEISHLILHAADFGLDDYHRCAMELSDKKLQNI